MIQTFMLNKVTSAFECLEDFPGAVDAVEAVYRAKPFRGEIGEG
jgi:hypothetical protein